MSFTERDSQQITNSSYVLSSFTIVTYFYKYNSREGIKKYKYLKFEMLHHLLNNANKHAK